MSSNMPAFGRALNCIVDGIVTGETTRGDTVTPMISRLLSPKKPVLVLGVFKGPGRFMQSAKYSAFMTRILRGTGNQR